MIKFLPNIERSLVNGCLVLILSVLLIACKDSATVYAMRKNIIASVYASGKIIAENEHNVFSLNNGSVVRKLVHEGDTVHSKQILFEINNITATSGLKVAQDKIQLLQQFSSTNDFPDKYYIRSDCKGVVYQTMKEQGEAVRMNESVALIGDACKRIIRLSVDQQDIGKIKAGQEVLLKTDITGDSIYTAVVTKVYSIMNEANQSFRVDAVFTNLLPHTFIHCPVEANIVVTKELNALVLPRKAMDDNDSVWIEQSGRKQKVKVRTGITTTDYVQILDGVDEKTKVIISRQK